MRRTEQRVGPLLFLGLLTPVVVWSSWRRPVGVLPVTLALFPSVRGRCVELGAGGTAPFFWQFVNGTHDTTDCLRRVVPLVTPAFSTRSTPLWRHSLPPFFLLAGDRTRNGPHHHF